MKKVIDGLLGFAIGDAMGVPIEYSIREKCLKNPVMEMLGNGSHNVPAGSWSDDTSMVVATMASYIDKETIDYNNIMDKLYEWLANNKYTADDKRFDIGRITLKGIYNYSRKNKDPLECGEDNVNSNDNESLKRMLPVAYYGYYNKLSGDDLYNLVKDMSSLTNAHEISVLGCYIYVLYVIKLLNGEDKITAYNDLQKEDYSMFSEESLELYNRILKNNLKDLKVHDIKSGSFIVDTLEASIWVTLNSKNYPESIIGAINLGEDTDTVGAITGSMTGIIYGYDEIPTKWLDKLLKKDYLIEIANNFEEVLNKNS